MDIQKSFKDALQIVQLKEPMMSSVAKDTKALQPALVLAAAAAVVGALGSLLFPVSYGMVTYRMDAVDFVVQAVVGAALAVAGLYVVGYLAEQVFHSKLNMQGYVRVMGHAAVVNFLGIIPALAPISGLWTLVVMCYVLNKLGKLSAGQIILLILLLVVVAAVLGFIFAAVLGFSSFGGGMMGSGMMDRW